MIKAKTIAARAGIVARHYAGKTASAVKSGHDWLIQIAGAIILLVGIAELVGYPYALIIGGLAAIVAIERQPSTSERTDAAKLASLETELRRLKSHGTTDVPVQSVLLAIGG